jgi:hypothetical protein
VFVVLSFFMCVPAVVATAMALGLTVLTLVWAWSAWTLAKVRQDRYWRGICTELGALARTPIDW